MTFQHTILAHLKEGWARHKKKIFITSGSVGSVVIVVIGGSFGYVKAFDGHIYPNVSIGNIDVGNMTQAEASEAIQAAYNSMLDRGLPVRFTDGDVNELSVINLRSDASTDPDLVYDLIDMDADQATREAFSLGRRSGNTFIDTFESLLLLVKPQSVHVPFSIADVQLEQAMKDEFGEFEEPSEHTKFEIEKTQDGYKVKAIEGTEGRTFIFEEVFVPMLHDLQNFSITEKSLLLHPARNIITEAEALALQDNLFSALSSAPYTLTFTSEKQLDFSWDIEEEDLMEWLVPVQNDQGNAVLGFDTEAMEVFLEEIKSDVNIAPQNARFQVDGDRVVEFAGSLNGVSFDAEATLDQLIQELGEQDVALAIAVETVEPDITTDSVNSLGITEIVGVGTSNFAGSPSNRISNIQHGAAKLNGLLIAPGEEFSLLEALKPFTIEDGWLPELVIKGDEIKPEVGGGACQFGTTLFRAAMYTGLEITQRRNHSLVVSYYNDPQNGNPGTDATIYDPAPDFRFRNDMEHYLLLTTEVDLKTKDMIFTFWGTSDGRKGSYTPPEILSWTGYGATITKETTSLPKGVKQCQAPHAGAVTSFDYNVEYADGTTFEHTYTSTYRSLPQVCLVGIGGDDEPDPEPEPTTDEEET